VVLTSVTTRSRSPRRNAGGAFGWRLLVKQEMLHHLWSWENHYPSCYPRHIYSDPLNSNMLSWSTWYLGNNSITAVLITDHLELSDIVFIVALRRRRLLCDRAYQFPIQPNLPVETDVGYSLGYIFVIVSVHLVNRTSHLRWPYYRLGCHS